MKALGYSVAKAKDKKGCRSCPTQKRSPDSRARGLEHLFSLGQKTRAMRFGERRPARSEGRLVLGWGWAG